MKTLAIIGINAPVAVRVNTVSRNPSIPVTTLTGEIWKIPNNKIPAIVVENVPTKSILLKLSDRLFIAPAM